jgi:predicted Fe-S protein YdhL (DUF1289 family)
MGRAGDARDGAYTIDEIAAWSRMSADQKRAVLAVLPGRLQGGF